MDMSINASYECGPFKLYYLAKSSAREMQSGHFHTLIVKPWDGSKSLSSYKKRIVILEHSEHFTKLYLNRMPASLPQDCNLTIRTKGKPDAIHQKIAFDVLQEVHRKYINQIVAASFKPPSSHLNFARESHFFFSQKKDQDFSPKLMSKTITSFQKKYSKKTFSQEQSKIALAMELESSQKHRELEKKLIKEEIKNNNLKISLTKKKLFAEAGF